MSVLLFPVRRISWGVFFGNLKMFVSQDLNNRDRFATWADCLTHITRTYSDKAIEKDNICPKPVKVYGYDELTKEDV